MRVSILALGAARAVLRESMCGRLWQDAGEMERILRREGAGPSTDRR